MSKIKERVGKISEKLSPYISLFWEFFKIGLFTIGGGMAMIPQMQEVAVNKNKWMTDSEMIDCIAISQSMPGVVAVNSATYIGRRQKGFKGAAVATLGVIFPSFIIIILVAAVLGAIDENTYIQGAFTGIKAAVCGLIAVTVVRMGKSVLVGALQWCLAAGSLIVVSLFDISAVWVIIAGIVIGIFYSLIKSAYLEKKKTDREEREEDK